MSLLSEIRRVKLTIPGIKAITVEEPTYYFILFALRNIQRMNLDGPQRVHKLFVDDIEIKKELTEQGEGWISVNERLPEDSDLALDVTFYSPNYLSNGGYWVEEDVYFANGNWCKYVGAGQYLDPYKPIHMTMHKQKVVAWKKHVTPKPYIPTEQETGEVK